MQRNFKSLYCVPEINSVLQINCFSSSHVWMWELDYKEIWAQNNWCFWTMVLEKTLEHPLDCMEIQPVHPKGNQSWIFIVRTDAEAETPILGHLMQITDSFEKTLMLGKIEGRRRRGWHRMRWLDGITNSMTWVWVNSGSWWWTGRPGVLQSMGSQRVRCDWTEQTNYTSKTNSQKKRSDLRLSEVGSEGGAGEGKLEEGNCQNVQTCSYKIKKC